VLDRRLSIAAGAGPYLSFDTDTEGAVGNDYRNDHEWGGVLSLSATWYLESRWLLETRVNSVWMDGDIDTTSILLGVGYQLEPPASTGPRPAASPQNSLTTENEVTLFLGSSVVNGPSEDSMAYGIEYRRWIARNLDWTVGWMDEIDTPASAYEGLYADTCRSNG
jgi:hypothetical protein